MLSQSIVRRARPLSVRARIFGGVVLSALAAVPRAGAQQPPGPQQQGQQTSPAPAVPQEPAAKSPAANSPAGQTQLPEIVVSGNQPKPKPKPNVPAPQRSAPTPTQAAVAPGAPTPAQAALDSKMKTMDQALNNLLPKTGASVDTLTRQDIVNLPQGDNTPIDKVILQFPGVSYDSAVSNPSFHVRGEYANVQIRINGIVLPEGVSALGPFLDTNFIGSMSLLTGTLPAQYGLRTAGVLDITSRSFAVPAGEASLYGGSHQTLTPSIDYGGSFANSEYFVTARGIWNTLGLENPTASLNAIHDYTQQGKFFGYTSTLLDESTRLSFISAASFSAFRDSQQPQSGGARRFWFADCQFCNAQRERIRHLCREHRWHGSDTAPTATRKSPPIRVTPTSISFPTFLETSSSTTRPQT